MCEDPSLKHFASYKLDTGDDDRSETKTINVDDVDVCPHYRVYSKDDLAHCQSQQLSNNEKFTHKLTDSNQQQGHLKYEN